MKILVTAGPTREPIDPVRYIGNRSSGKMGAALSAAALAGGHEVTLIVGPVSAAMPQGIRRIDVETAAQMHDAVLREFPAHQLLIMAAAVADFRPVRLESRKLSRGQAMSIECEPTEDIVAAAGAAKRPDQRIVGFSLEARGDIDRARQKLLRKNLDLVVYNPIETMESAAIEPVLLWRDGKSETLPSRGKADFARVLLERAIALFKT